MLPRGLRRREFLQFTSASAIAFVARGLIRAEDATTVQPQSFVYKTVDGVEISADVYCAADDVVRPVVMWIHGGALIVGHRSNVDRRIKRLFLDAGYVVVSIDYRVAPETKLPAILEDVRDACRWVRERGRELFAGDAEKLIVTGGSAGGYLTLATGYLVEPRPAALVSIYGYGDLTGEWYARPDAFYRAQPHVSREEALAAVGDRPLTNGNEGKQRGRFYLYCRQQGLWPQYVSGHDPHRESAAFDAFCPLRNVTSDYPPTLFIHGTEDTDVPYQQSTLMADEMRIRGIEHELITVSGAGHGLSGVEPARADEAYAAILPFLDRVR